MDILATADLCYEPSTRMSTGYTGQITYDQQPHDYRVHFNECPRDLVESLWSQDDVEGLISQIAAAENDVERLSCDVRKLLTRISTSIYDFFTPEDRARLNLRISGPIVFLLRRHKPSLDADRSDAPSIVGVLPFEGFKDCPILDDGSYLGIPTAYVDTFVETQWLYYSSDRGQEHRCAIDFLRRWPDRAGLYCMTLHPRGFKLHYADSSGAKSSDVMSWDNHGFKRISDYVYSLYHPPARHFLRDLTMTVHEYPNLDRPLWSIRVNDEIFPYARNIFLAGPGWKRTAVFLAGQRPQQQAIIKDSYRKPLGYYEEPTFLKHIHCHGFIPGVIRLAHEELVYFAGEDNMVSVYRSPRVKHRMVLADIGESLLHAKSVNDLLMAIYDALEVHRVLASRAKVLHRDMSLNNILMYPRWARCTNTQVLDGMPPLIDDVLGSEAREADMRTARCMLIDFDFASMLSSSPHPESIPAELRHRVGTPMYVARAVAVGRVLFVRHVPLRMPTLAEEAKELYVRAYGQDRYDKYCDDASTYHGGIPEELSEDTWGSSARCRGIRFHHRWEHDVESVYWTMYSALLRVRPRGYLDDERMKDTLHCYWRMLRSHEFLERTHQECENLPQDTRTPLLDCDHDAFLRPFPPIMQDVSRLLFDIAQHVRISYAAMSVPPKHEDHLHEAVQRLILDYLVRHREDPIWLDSDELRISDTPPPVFDTRSSSNSDYLMASENPGEREVPGMSGGVSRETGETETAPSNLVRTAALLEGNWSYPYFDPSAYEIRDD
ncbi:hypothetical protein BV20DRAFT_71775 [Pilatotrama ljubarskyi]|nr:hypothetical protein BV20DRAFT_71775 [Pilatotrama ljubarskyi]